MPFNKSLCWSITICLLAGAGATVTLSDQAANTTPATAPAPIDVSNPGELTTALLQAGTVPNTTIRFTADITLPRSREVRGKGTVIDLNGHTYGYNGHFNGTEGGMGLTVMPSLSKAGPIDPTKPAILCNPSGGVTAVEKALGGAVFPPFVEPAPVQYADEKDRRDTYTQQRNILIPAENITIRNGKMACIDPQALSPLNIAWARGVTVKDVVFDFRLTKVDNAGTGAQESENVSFDGCDFGGHNIAFNSAYNVNVANSRNGQITFEERCVVATVQKCALYAIRVDDVTCTDMKFIGNTITGDLLNWGCIALPELGGDNLIQDNTLIQGKGSQATLWLGYVPGTLKITGNKGLNLIQYGATEKHPRIVDEKNEWSERK